MALHRITGLVRELTCRLETEEETATTETTEGETTTTTTKPKRALWPRNTPCAVIERASCPDQRVIRTTLEYVAEAIEAEGSRPPGLLVVGRACEALYESEKGRTWVVEDGFKGFDFEELPGLS
ncbi:siroheme synthase [Colletotrichum higginsianum]|nr:siroheme synthase [Colletotrichum higginsianum]